MGRVGGSGCELSIDQINAIASKFADAVLQMHDDENERTREKVKKHVTFSNEKHVIADFLPHELSEADKNFYYNNSNIDDIESITSDDLSLIAGKDIVSDVSFSFASFLDIFAQHLLSYSYSLKRDIIHAKASGKITNYSAVSLDLIDNFDKDAETVIIPKDIYIIETERGKRKFITDC